MTRLNVARAVLFAALLSAAPFSINRSPANGGPIAFETAHAAELSIPPHRRVFRHAHYYRGASYDLHCGGPYAHGGWNGGSYWGGPWMDLRCYGVPVAVTPPEPNYLWWSF
jgi:hypothetical protein